MKRDLFRQKVMANFQFLELDFGYQLVENQSFVEETDKETVVYELPPIRVEIYCSISEGWGLEILLEHRAFGEFSFHTYLNLVDLDISRILGLSLASSDDELFELMDIYSCALIKFGCAILLGDSREWSLLKRAEELGEGLTEISAHHGRFCKAPENPTWH